MDGRVLIRVQGTLTHRLVSADSQPLSGGALCVPLTDWVEALGPREERFCADRAEV